MSDEPGGRGPGVAERFHVTVAFRPDGPVVAGVWSDGGVAVKKFLGFVGSHGSVDGVVVTLWAEAGGSWEELQVWRDGRLVVYRQI